MGADATFDNTRERSRSYYAPDNLVVGRAFGEIEVKLSKRLWLDGRAQGRRREDGRGSSRARRRQPKDRR